MSDDPEILRQEIARLRKVNEVLMRRVQRSMDTAGSDYGLFEQAIHLQKVVEERTTELRARNAELRAATVRAEAAVRSKSRFLATMSHELRTPLHVLLSAIQILGEDASSEHEELLSLMNGAGEHLLALIDDILDFTRAESGTLSLSEGEVSVRDTVGSVLAGARHLSVARGLALRSSIDDDVPDTIITDGRRLKQVLFNLVGNACKFTDAGDTTIAVARDGDSLLFRVADTGRGIPKDALTRVQERFVQVHDDDARDHGGAGLGLAICRELVGLWHGELTVRSTLGVGTCVSFTLPLHLPDAPTMVPSEADWDDVGPMQVLLVDDHPVNRFVARKLLERDGACVTEAASGAEALAQLAAGPLPDLVLMDCQMPGMDGFEATRRIRALSGPAGRLRIVALTASVLDEDREQCLEAGMDGHLTKPLDRAALRREMAAAVAPDAEVEDVRTA